MGCGIAEMVNDPFKLKTPRTTKTPCSHVEQATQTSQHRSLKQPADQPQQHQAYQLQQPHQP